MRVDQARAREVRARSVAAAYVVAARVGIARREGSGRLVMHGSPIGRCCEPLKSAERSCRGSISWTSRSA